MLQGVYGRIGFVTNCFGPSAMAAAPDDIATLKAALAAAERRADRAEAEVANRRAKASHAEALIAHLTLEIEKLKRELYGTRSKKARLLEEAVSRASAERAGGRSGADRMPVLRLGPPVEAR